MTIQPLDLLRHFFAAGVRRETADLTARQMAVFLTVYRTPGPHTVRGLAAELNVAKPVITRVLDRFRELDLARRSVDPTDRRSVLVLRTDNGRDLQSRIACDFEAAQAAARAPARSAAANRKEAQTNVAA